MERARERMYKRECEGAIARCVLDNMRILLQRHG